MPLEKVTITVLEGSNANTVIKAQFNPEEYTINKDNNVAVQPIPGLSAPLLQYINGNLRTLEMELFFDTWDSIGLPKVDVRLQTNRIIALMDIDSETHAPPRLKVSWASLQMDCVLARVSQKFIMFSEPGYPVRARLSCTFNEVIDPVQEIKRINAQTSDYTKVHVVKQGETLSGIAASLYKNPQLWRSIAVANEIDDPRAIAVGCSLVVPSLPFRDPVTREVVA